MKEVVNDINIGHVLPDELRIRRVYVVADRHGLIRNARCLDAIERRFRLPD